jgi:HEAT repeat protein
MSMKPVVTYDFDGVKHVQQGHSFRAITGDECEIFQEIQDLERQHNWAAVRDLCETQIEKTPEWLTPYLCAGVAHANLGRREEAIQRLEHVEKASAGNPLYSAAARIPSQLRREAASSPIKAESIN